MRKNINLTIFAVTIIMAGTGMTSCHTGNKNENPDIKQVDTPAVQQDVTKQGTDTIHSVDTTKNMKDEIKKKPLVLIIDNLGSPIAPVEVSVYSPENKFPAENGQLKKYRFTPSGTKLVATISDLEYGQYAVATYQDLDADGKIGKNMIGIPTDPYGFSNNYVPKIKAPNFKDCSFDYAPDQASITISMIRKK